MHVFDVSTSRVREHGSEWSDVTVGDQRVETLHDRGVADVVQPVEHEEQWKLHLVDGARRPIEVNTSPAAEKLRRDPQLGEWGRPSVL